MAWLQNAIMVSDFSAPRWQTPYVYNPSVRPALGAAQHQSTLCAGLSAAMSHPLQRCRLSASWLQPGYLWCR